MLRKKLRADTTDGNVKHLGYVASRKKVQLLLSRLGQLLHVPVSSAMEGILVAASTHLGSVSPGVSTDAMSSTSRYDVGSASKSRNAAPGSLEHQQDAQLADTEVAAGRLQGQQGQGYDQFSSDCLTFHVPHESTLCLTVVNRACPEQSSMQSHAQQTCQASAMHPPPLEQCAAVNKDNTPWPQHDHVRSQREKDGCDALMELAAGALAMHDPCSLDAITKVHPQTSDHGTAPAVATAPTRLIILLSSTSDSEPKVEQLRAIADAQSELVKELNLPATRHAASGPVVDGLVQIAQSLTHSLLQRLSAESAQTQGQSADADGPTGRT